MGALGSAQTSDPSSLAGAAAFRAETGLAADDATVAASFQDPIDYGDRSFGWPLAKSEAAEVGRQIDAQLALLKTAQTAAGQPGFATAYFERDVLHITTTRDPAGLGTALSSTIPVGGRVEIGRASMTQAALVGIQQRVSDDASVLARLNVHVVEVGIDPYTAQVEVSIPSADDRSAAQATLSDRYGAGIEVVQRQASGSLLACNSRYDCGTKGGLAAAHAVPGGNVLCTTGFVTRSNSSATNYLMTAGHCIRDSGGTGSGVAWRNEQGTLTWGPNVSYLFGANFDEGIFGIGSTPPAAYNQYFASSPSDIRTIDHAELPYAAMPAGLIVCRSGRTSGWACNPIHRANVNWWDGSMTHFSVWEVSMVSTFGDSGAGYIAFGQHSGTYPAGILFAGDTGSGALYTYYYPVVDDYLIGVHVCITAAC